MPYIRDLTVLHQLAAYLGGSSGSNLVTLHHRHVGLRGVHGILLTDLREKILQRKTK